MRLKKMMSWIRRTPDATPDALAANATATDIAPAALPEVKTPGAAVIALPGASVPPAGPMTEELIAPPAMPGRITGLLNAPELEAFFAANQFGLGRHDGTRYRSLESLDRGLDAIVAEFQQIAAGLAERRQAKIDRLKLELQKVESLSPSIAAQLELAIEQTRREVDVLAEQTRLAEQRRGWVLDALNRYRLGFDRGVRDAIDFELLGA